MLPPKRDVAYIFGDDSTSATSVDKDNTNTSTTSQGTNYSAGTESIDTLEVHKLGTEDVSFNYRGPKVLPRNKFSVIICTADTIGTLHSQRLFQVLLDSGSNACLIKRSALQQGIKVKELSAKKSFNTLAGKLFSDEIVNIWDICLPEFDKSRCISVHVHLFLTMRIANTILF